MRRFLLSIFTLATLSSCEKVNFEESITPEVEQTEQTKKFTFTVKGDFMNPDFLEGGTRAVPYMTADGVEMTDLWIVDFKDGEIKQEKHQTSADSDWGKPTMSLSLGFHHIYFLASRGAEPVYENGIVTWTKPLDTFYLDYEVEVVKTSNGNRAVTLNRCASYVNIIIEDAIPAGTKKIEFTPSHWFDGFNMITGEAVEAHGFLRVYDIPDSWGGRKGGSLTLWTLADNEEWTTSLNIVSRTASAKNAEITIPDVPMKANRATIYRGNLYTNASESSVSLNAEWQQAYEGIY